MQISLKKKILLRIPSGIELTYVLKDMEKSKKFILKIWCLPKISDKKNCHGCVRAQNIYQKTLVFYAAWYGVATQSIKHAKNRAIYDFY